MVTQHGITDSVIVSKKEWEKLMKDAETKYTRAIGMDVAEAIETLRKDGWTIRPITMAVEKEDAPQKDPAPNSEAPTVPLVESVEESGRDVAVCTHTYDDDGMKTRSIWHMRCRDEAQAEAIAKVLSGATMPAAEGK
jgi:hypothetical protein